MRIVLFGKLTLAAICTILLAFAVIPDISIIAILKIFAFEMAISIGVAVFYPDFRGVKHGDTVSLVSNPSLPSILGRMGKACADGKKNEKIKVLLENGNEVVGIIENYVGIISPAKIRLIYEERLVD